MPRLINWFEIPATDFDRARRFYEIVFDVTLKEETFGAGRMGVFPYPEGSTGGAIVCMENMVPSSSGVVIYLDGGDNVDAPLGRVREAGGTVVMPKTQISPEIGHIALFRDSEGNVIGLHSPH
jgi:predicted enzyme related to lactoylglutathione lyase